MPWTKRLTTISGAVSWLLIWRIFADLRWEEIVSMASINSGRGCYFFKSEARKAEVWVGNFLTSQRSTST